MGLSHGEAGMILFIPAGIALVLLIANRIRVHFNNFVNDGEWFITEHDDLESIYSLFNSRDTFTGSFFAVVIPFGIFLLDVIILLFLQFPLVVGCVVGSCIVTLLLIYLLVCFGKRERKKKLFEDKLRGK